MAIQTEPLSTDEAALYKRPLLLFGTVQVISTYRHRTRRMLTKSGSVVPLGHQTPSFHGGERLALASANAIITHSDNSSADPLRRLQLVPLDVPGRK
jgi:hypothetical protein